jgi:hypothetical protein
MKEDRDGRVKHDVEEYKAVRISEEGNNNGLCNWDPNKYFP